MDCEPCQLLLELWQTTPQTPRDYWVMTELFMLLHDNKDYCEVNRPLPQTGKGTMIMLPGTIDLGIRANEKSDVHVSTALYGVEGNPGIYRRIKPDDFKSGNGQHVQAYDGKRLLHLERVSDMETVLVDAMTDENTDVGKAGDG